MLSTYYLVVLAFIGLSFHLLSRFENELNEASRPPKGRYTPFDRIQLHPNMDGTMLLNPMPIVSPPSSSAAAASTLSASNPVTLSKLEKARMFAGQTRRDLEFDAPIPQGIYYINLKKSLPLQWIEQDECFLGTSTTSRYSDRNVHGMQMKTESNRMEKDGLETIEHESLQANVHISPSRQGNKIEASGVIQKLQSVLKALSWYQRYSWTILSHYIRMFMLELNVDKKKVRMQSRDYDSERGIHLVWLDAAMPFYVLEVEDSSGGKNKATFKLQCMQMGHVAFGHFLVHDFTTKGLILAENPGKSSIFRTLQVDRDEWYILQVYDGVTQAFITVDVQLERDQLHPNAIIRSDARAEDSVHTALVKFKEATDVALQHELLEQTLLKYPHLIDEKSGTSTDANALEPSMERVASAPMENKPVIHTNDLFFAHLRRAIHRFPVHQQTLETWPTLYHDHHHNNNNIKEKKAKPSDDPPSSWGRSFRKPTTSMQKVASSSFFFPTPARSKSSGYSRSRPRPVAVGIKVVKYIVRLCL